MGTRMKVRIAKRTRMKVRGLQAVDPGLKYVQGYYTLLLLSKEGLKEYGKV